MQPTLDATGTGIINTAGTSVSWSHTCTGASALLVYLWIANTHSGVSVTYNSVAMTQVGSITNSSSRTLYVYYLANPSSGANTVSCTWTTSRLAAGGSVSYAGAGLYGSTLSNSGTTAASTSVSPSNASDQIFVNADVAFRNTDATNPTITVTGNNTNLVTVAGAGSFGCRLRLAEDSVVGASTASFSMANNTDFCHLGVYLSGQTQESNFFF